MSLLGVKHHDDTNKMGVTALTVAEQKFVFRESLFEYMRYELGLGGATPLRFKVRAEMIDSRVANVEEYYQKVVDAACVVVEGVDTSSLGEQEKNPTRTTFWKVGRSAVKVAGSMSVTTLMGGLAAGGVQDDDDDDDDTFPNTTLPASVSVPLEQRLQATMNDSKKKSTDWSRPQTPSTADRELPLIGVFVHLWRKIVSWFALGLVLGAFVLLWAEAWSIQGIVYLAAAEGVRNSETALSNEIRAISQSLLVTPAPASWLSS